MNALSEALQGARRIVFFGGAGVSVPSGIPDFRGENGLYAKEYDGLTAEMLLSHSFFCLHPDIFYDFYKKHMLYPNAKPNIVHVRLAEMERTGRVTAVVTQNIDGLHTRAGSKNVYELHGSIYRNHCMNCGKFYSAEDIMDMDTVPRCSCGGVIKPDVVLYEEGLDSDVLQGAVTHIMRADMLIVGGTSLAVYPAAGLIDYYRGNRLVLINKSETPYDKRADLVIHESIGRVLSETVKFK